LTGPGRVWTAVSGVFTGVPADGPSGRPAPGPAGDELPFVARLSGEVARHPARLLAACLATVLGPAVVAHAGSAGSSVPGVVQAGSGAVAAAAVTVVPAPGDLATWKAAARAAADACPGLPAGVLVAIGRVESGLGVLSAPSTAGALGPMQFLPATWAAYGVDGDGDGRADVGNAADAIQGAAHLLCANGGADPGRLAGALWDYNHSDDYVARVLSLARSADAGG
jgi:hypothetical protein